MNQVAAGACLVALLQEEDVIPPGRTHPAAFLIHFRGGSHLGFIGTAAAAQFNRHLVTELAVKIGDAGDALQQVSVCLAAAVELLKERPYQPALAEILIRPDRFRAADQKRNAGIGPGLGDADQGRGDAIGRFLLNQYGKGAGGILFVLMSAHRASRRQCVRPVCRLHLRSGLARKIQPVGQGHQGRRNAKPALPQEIYSTSRNGHGWWSWDLLQIGINRRNSL